MRFLVPVTVTTRRVYSVDAASPDEAIASVTAGLADLFEDEQVSEDIIYEAVEEA